MEGCGRGGAEVEAVRDGARERVVVGIAAVAGGDVLSGGRHGVDQCGSDGLECFDDEEVELFVQVLLVCH